MLSKTCDYPEHFERHQITQSALKALWVQVGFPDGPVTAKLSELVQYSTMR